MRRQYLKFLIPARIKKKQIELESVIVQLINRSYVLSGNTRCNYRVIRNESIKVKVMRCELLDVYVII